jgi:hypothetical protein
MSVGVARMGPPLRMPDGFTTRIAAMVPVGDRILAVWNQRPKVRNPGGLRYQWLGGRRGSDTEELTRIPDVNAIDGVPHGEGALLAWTEEDGPGGGYVMKAELPDGAPKQVPFPDPGVDGVRIVPSYGGKGPWLSVTTLDGALRVCTLEGEMLATLGD